LAVLNRVDTKDPGERLGNSRFKGFDLGSIAALDGFGG